MMFFRFNPLLWFFGFVLFLDSTIFNCFLLIECLNEDVEKIVPCRSRDHLPSLKSEVPIYHEALLPQKAFRSHNEKTKKIERHRGQKMVVEQRSQFEHGESSRVN